jgi:hypothetical protein
MRRHNRIAYDLLRSSNAASTDGTEPWHGYRHALSGGWLAPAPNLNSLPRF